MYTIHLVCHIVSKRVAIIHWWAFGQRVDSAATQFLGSGHTHWLKAIPIENHNLKTHRGEKSNRLKTHIGEKSNKCNQCDYSSAQFFGSGHTPWQPLWLKIIIFIIFLMTNMIVISVLYLAKMCLSLQSQVGTVETAVRHNSRRSVSIIDSFMSCMIHPQISIFALCLSVKETMSIWQL